MRGGWRRGVWGGHVTSVTDVRLCVCLHLFQVGEESEAGPDPSRTGYYLWSTRGGWEGGWAGSSGGGERLGEGGGGG